VFVFKFAEDEDEKLELDLALEFGIIIAEDWLLLLPTLL
jgi:hypothetical protein